MNATDRAALAVLHAQAIDGVAAVSTRHLAELIGRSSSTAAALQRLANSHQQLKQQSLIILIACPRLSVRAIGLNRKPCTYTSRRVTVGSLVWSHTL